MRDYILDCGLEKERYLELCHFCRQFPTWVRDLESAHRVGIPAEDPRNKAPLLKLQTVEQCAKAVDGGKWHAALIKNICFQVPYSAIPIADLPTLHRNEFFTAKRLFFEMLDRRRDSTS